MSGYTQGTIVWYRRAVGDSSISYAGVEPCAATVSTVRSPTSADLTIMVDNSTPITRTNVPLADPSSPPASGHWASIIRG